jgi:hypothetical protein
MNKMEKKKKKKKKKKPLAGEMAHTCNPSYSGG